MPSVIFASSESYTLGGDWQMYTDSTFNQWALDPNYNLWIQEAPNGYEGLKLEIDASPIPEPSVVSTLLVALAIAIGRAKSRR